MELLTERYGEQQEALPKTGQQIIAQYDADNIVVYQAYKSAIAAYAAEKQQFGSSEYSFNRMSWIKPNFLWMMYRSGWATKPGQEAILAIWIKRKHFEHILMEAIHSSFKPDMYATQPKWQQALRNSDVRLQWDPDHNPYGLKLERKAIQLGLRESMLKQFAVDWIVDIQDITPFVTEQRKWVEARDLDHLLVPQEREYYVNNPVLERKLGIQYPVTE